MRPLCLEHSRAKSPHTHTHTHTHTHISRIRTLSHQVLVAPYCAIPRDYLSDAPLLRAMGFLVPQHGQLGALPPPRFLSVSPGPCRACEVEVRYPPPQYSKMTTNLAKLVQLGHIGTNLVPIWPSTPCPTVLRTLLKIHG